MLMSFELWLFHFKSLESDHCVLDDATSSYFSHSLVFLGTSTRTSCKFPRRSRREHNRQTRVESHRIMICIFIVTRAAPILAKRHLADGFVFLDMFDIYLRTFIESSSSPPLIYSAQEVFSDKYGLLLKIIMRGSLLRDR